MPLGGLRHCTIEPGDLERGKEFDCNRLGMQFKNVDSAEVSCRAPATPFFSSTIPRASAWS